MDALQFGQWLSEQRRRHGWRSQRTFVVAAQQEPLLQELHISEDFMGRLEAGLLVHPFRGSVRRRVLALSKLLCKNPRELRTYLRAAELGQLSVEEEDYLERLTRSFTGRQAPAPLLLPPRPAHLVGRGALVQDLLRACSSIEQGICALTGMAGVGKSALAAEAVHRLAANADERLRFFPDGIVSLTCTGRRGPAGLLALLEEIIEIFSPAAKHAERKRKAGHEQSALVAPETALAAAIDRARLALAGRRALLLLDNLDAQFPIRQACDALLAQGVADGTRSGLVILTTSCHVLPLSLTACHLRVNPLEPEAAYELFVALLGRIPGAEEGEAVRRICTAVGYLPLAIEEAATAAVAEGTALELLAVRAEEYPLDRLLDGSGEVRSRLNEALKTMDPALFHRFALLSLLGKQFGLEAATAAQETNLTGRLVVPDNTAGSVWQPAQRGLIVSNGAGAIAFPPSSLATTAADLGQMVRHSLIELAPSTPANGSPAALIPHHASLSNSMRYRFHPLLLAHAAETLRFLDANARQTAQQNVRAYALDYVQRYAGDIERLEQEWHFLSSVVEHAWDERQYGLVIELVWGLAPILTVSSGIGEESRRLLRLGAAASQELQQYYHLSRFVNHLGALYYYAGDFTQAARLWHECLDIIEASEGPHAHFLWLPLINLAEMDSALGNHDAALRRADAYLRHAREEYSDATRIAGGFFFRGRIKRRRGDAQGAYDDLCESERLFASLSDAKLPPSLISEKLYAQAELARVQGDYEKAREYTQELAQAFGGRVHCEAAEAWLDMAQYAYQQKQFDDAHVMAQRALEMATQVGAHHLRKSCLELLSKLTGVFLATPRQR